MQPSSKVTSEVTGRQVISARVFHIRRDIVFKAWAEPEYLAQWWGPQGFTNTFHEFNFTEGGNWRFTMHGPDGKDYPNQNIFEEIKAPEQIVLRHDCQPYFLATFVFDDLGEQTRVTFTQLFDSADVFSKIKDIVVPANEENFDRLEIQLAKLLAQQHIS
ncbi:SRPBCC family protein [Mucilaginibacter lacusdianchii]|uniref:SRPBCC family protein n=1 Tax=Mucilaginibacter lacusdianchii TaxID=2684211 RepID=UPI00131DFE14|nr:SRPBCC family protein [Mucilaginibacter sp. JXJ CY 39]